jgi:hypothetical protein
MVHTITDYKMIKLPLIINFVLWILIALVRMSDRPIGKQPFEVKKSNECYSTTAFLSRCTGYITKVLLLNKALHEDVNIYHQKIIDSYSLQMQ